MEFASTAVGAGELQMPPTPGSGEMGQAILGAQQAALFMEILESLYTRVKLLEQKVKDLEEEKYQKLRNERDLLKDIHDKCAPKRLVIAFVELIEKADKYFELEDYLKMHSDIKLDSDPDYILNTIVQSPVRTERFKMLENEFIRNTIEERISRVKDAKRESSLYKYRMFLTRHDLVMINSRIKDVKNAIVLPRNFPGLSSNEMENELQSYKTFISSSSSSREDRVAKYLDNAKKKFDTTLAREKFENPSGDMIYDVVFRSRDGLYAMDHDPEVELQKMLEFGPAIMIDLIPMLKKMMTLDQASTVFVCDVPPHASDDDIKESFSYYGDIISVEMLRLDEFQVAYVTYKDRKDAKLAVSVEKAKVCNEEVRVLSQRFYQAPAGSGYIPMVKPLKEQTEERFRNMREKALKKYKDLIKRHAELQVTDGKAASGGTYSVMKNDVANASTIPSMCNAKHIEAGSSGGSVDEMSRSMSSVGFVEMEKMGQAQKFEAEKKVMEEAKREARRKKMEMEALRSFFRPGSSGGF